MTDTMNPLKPLAGRFAVVTGSTNGIGVVIAHALATARPDLVINGLGNADAIDAICPAVPFDGDWAAK